MTPTVIDLVPVGDGAGRADLALTLTTGEWFRSLLYRNFLLLLIVVAPTTVTAVYYVGIASNRYESETKFVVRSPNGGASNPLSSFIQASSIARSADDAYVVQEFILSRDAMNYLEQSASLREVYQREGIDFLSRFPLPWRAATDENFYRYYLDFVSVNYDHSTGITSLRVRAFRAQDAQRIANSLLERAEVFINGLNQRVSADAVGTGFEEVKTAEQRAHAALDQITEFRNRVRFIDPTQASMASLNAIATLSLTTAETNATLAGLEKETPDAPKLASLRHKVESLQGQIAIERQKLAGGPESLAPHVVEYEKLVLNQTFAEKAFLSALATLAAARLEAIKQRVFLEPITSATAPDYPVYPRRWFMVMATLVITLMVWRILKSIIADTAAHGAH